MFRFKLIFAVCFLCGAVACSDTPAENQQNEEVASKPVVKPQLSEEEIMTALNTHFEKRFMANPSFYPYHDKVANQPLQLDMTKFVKDSLRQVSDTQVAIGYQALTLKKDSVWLDFEVTWNPPSGIADTTKGKLEVSQISLRRVKNDTRYEWKKTGKFWDKQVVNAGNPI